MQQNDSSTAAAKRETVFNERLEITRMRNPACQEDCLIQDGDGSFVIGFGDLNTPKHMQIFNHMKLFHFGQM